MTVTNGRIESSGGEVLRVRGQVQLKLYVGMFGAKATETRRQPAGADGRQGRDRKTRLIQIGGANEAGAQGRECIHRFACDQLTWLGELDLVWMTEKQRHSDLPLQLSNVITHRRGGCIQFLRRLGKTAQAS